MINTEILKQNIIRLVEEIEDVNVLVRILAVVKRIDR